MSASEPLVTDRKRQTLSKPGALLISGTSLRGTWVLRKWQPVYRRHDLETGFTMERENLSL